jgi:hypothetical protein
MPDGSIYTDTNDSLWDKRLLELKISLNAATTQYERESIEFEIRTTMFVAGEGNYNVRPEHSLADYYIPDVTNSLVGLMGEYEADFHEHHRDLFWFVEHVKSDSLVDLKRTNQEFKRESYSYHIIFDCEVMRADAPGNILFGYVGTAAGFSEDELRRGAGLYQLYEDSDRNLFSMWINYPKLFEDYGDNPGDGEQIKMGVAYYFESKHPGYEYPNPMPGPPPQ